jgi:hypothetical protein
MNHRIPGIFPPSLGADIDLSAACRRQEASGSRTSGGRVHRTTSLEAYHAYLKGRHYWSKRSVDAVRAAIGYFRQAIDLDPTYALAYVGLAECFVVLRVHSWPCGSRRPAHGKSRGVESGRDR